jgi:hypothetical protein
MEIIVSRDVIQCTLVDLYRLFGSLKMDAARFYQTSLRHISEDSNYRPYLCFRGKREVMKEAASAVKADQGNINSAS